MQALDRSMSPPQRSTRPTWQLTITLKTGHSHSHCMEASGVKGHVPKGPKSRSPRAALRALRLLRRAGGVVPAAARY
eukprot:scaffold215197_cov32-Tisochrysis_lutea.AAC.1